MNYKCHTVLSSFRKTPSKKSDEEYENRRGSPILVMLDTQTGMVSSEFVNSTGVNEYAIRRAKNFIEKLGHKKVIFEATRNLLYWRFRTK